MTSDLTILFYSACLVSAHFGAVVRAELLHAIDGRFPIISVTHLPLDFGDVRHVVGDVTPSIQQVYRNVLIGAKLASTPYVAFAEDDNLPTREHFDYRPPLDVFAYNENRVVLTRKLSDDGKRREAFFYFRPRTQLAQGICGRELLIETLTERFARYPNPPLDTTITKKAGWGEMGRYEKNLGLTRRKLARFRWTIQPNVVINHGGLMGRRRVQPEDTIYDSVEPWGKADDLWRRIHG